MGYNDDVYSSPERFDLSLVKMLDEAALSYEFHMLGVWQHSDGRLFWAIDSGCSCPSPFEDYLTLESLSSLTTGTYPEFELAVNSFPVDAVERAELLHAVKRILNR